MGMKDRSLSNFHVDTSAFKHFTLVANIKMVKRSFVENKTCVSFVRRPLQNVQHLK